jgi:predicted MPP superfamily phosphohydrolase
MARENSTTMPRSADTPEQSEEKPEPVGAVNQRRTRRRVFLKRFLGGAVGLGAAGLGYSLFEAGWIRIHRTTLRVPRLPLSFQGSTVAFLADIHHGPFTSLDYVQRVVQLTNSLSPDAVLLGGDYVHRDGQYIGPCFEALSRLKTPWGTYGVLGNHDHWEGAAETRQAMKAGGIVEMTNSGVWIERGGSRLRLSGVGDLWEDVQDLDEALADTQQTETAIVLSHNPDFVESITDRRVGLVLSGHTHGGQVVLPIVGAPRVPSRYGQKYLHGLVKTPHTQVFVTRGLGTVTPPVRFCCRPEIALITIA